jgi:hypothetical protein
MVFSLLSFFFSAFLIVLSLAVISFVFTLVK